LSSPLQVRSIAHPPHTYAVRHCSYGRDRPSIPSPFAKEDLCRRRAVFYIAGPRSPANLAALHVGLYLSCNALGPAQRHIRPAPPPSPPQLDIPRLSCGVNRRRLPLWLEHVETSRNPHAGVGGPSPSRWRAADMKVSCKCDVQIL